jgi:hypothetical protein
LAPTPDVSDDLILFSTLLTLLSFFPYIVPPPPPPPHSHHHFPLTTSSSYNKFFHPSVSSFSYSSLSSRLLIF